MTNKTKTEDKAPEYTPPTAEELALGSGEPTLTLEDALSEALAAPGDLAPTQFPPTETAIEAADEGLAAWHNGKKITALWSDRSNRNSWIAIQGMGWKKLATKNDSSLVSLTLIASHAEQTGSTVNVRIESDNRVHEIYAW